MGRSSPVRTARGGLRALLGPGAAGDPTGGAGAARSQPAPLADLDRLTKLTESLLTKPLDAQPLEVYECLLPDVAAAVTAKLVHDDIVALLPDDVEGVMSVSSGAGLTSAERRIRVRYDHDVMRKLFRAAVGSIGDIEPVRGSLAGIPGSFAKAVMIMPLVHERRAFGALMAGRSRSQAGLRAEVFTDADVETPMGFAEATVSPLGAAVLLRHLAEGSKFPRGMGQLPSPRLPRWR